MGIHVCACASSIPSGGGSHTSSADGAAAQAAAINPPPPPLQVLQVLEALQVRHSLHHTSGLERRLLELSCSTVGQMPLASTQQATITAEPIPMPKAPSQFLGFTSPPSMSLLAACVEDSSLTDTAQTVPEEDVDVEVWANVGVHADGPEGSAAAELAPVVGLDVTSPVTHGTHGSLAEIDRGVTALFAGAGLQALSGTSQASWDGGVFSDVKFYVQTLFQGESWLPDVMLISFVSLIIVQCANVNQRVGVKRPSQYPTRQLLPHVKSLFRLNTNGTIWLCAGSGWYASCSSIQIGVEYHMQESCHLQPRSSVQDSIPPCKLSPASEVLLHSLDINQMLPEYTAAT